MNRKSDESGTLNIGRILRTRRKELGLTLDDLAAGSGVTKSFLSEIERDLTSPSVASLVRICQTLNLPVGSLFAAVGSSVVRKEERTPINFGGKNIQDYLLTPTASSKIQSILSEMEPGGGGGDDLYSISADEEFVLVLSGSVTIMVDAEEFVLEEGDTLTFDPKRPHSFRNSSNTEPATALFTISPPPR